MEKYYILVETGNKNATFITNESGYEIFYLFPKQYESLDGSKSPSADFNIVYAKNQMIAFKKFVSIFSKNFNQSLYKNNTKSFYETHFSFKV